MRSIRTLIGILVLCLIAPAAAYSIDSIELGIKYRVPEEPFLFRGWKHITFLGDEEYRLESDTVVYEGELAGKPEKKGWSLQPLYKGKIWRVTDPVNDDIFIMAGNKTNSIKIVFLRLMNPVHTWAEFATHKNLTFKTYILERAKE
jgi:hypothetical protein